MALVYQSYASTSPSKVDGAYIFSLAATVGSGLAAITSANELFVVDRQNLSSAQAVFFEGPPSGTNCLIAGDDQGQSLICSGTEGCVIKFDVRSQKKIAQFKIDRAVTAIASDGPRIAVGTEFKSQQAIVSVWDTRQTKKIWQNGENNDEITALDFHPSRPEVVLTGGDDGLVSLFDTNVQDEEESLLQVINHGPIHKAGFLGRDRVFALSSDQNLAFHPVSTPDDNEDPPPTLVGDLRPIIPCQYVIDVLKSGNGFVVAAGTNTGGSRVDLVKLDNATDLDQQPTLNAASKYVLEPAHGEEVVRAILLDEQAGVIYTAGEDGVIQAFRQSSATPSHGGPVESRKLKTTKHKKSSEGRYKPY